MRQIDRLHYMDSLRAFAMSLGLVLHASVMFALWTNDPNRTHDEPSNILLYTFDLILVFRMQLFFLVAGFFSLMVCQNRGAASYAKNRFMRIVVPFVLCVLLLQPLAAADLRHQELSGGPELEVLDAVETQLPDVLNQLRDHPAETLREGLRVSKRVVEADRSLLAIHGQQAGKSIRQHAEELDVGVRGHKLALQPEHKCCYFRGIARSLAPKTMVQNGSANRQQTPAETDP